MSASTSSTTDERVRKSQASATSRTLLEGVRAHDSQAWDRLIRLYTPFVLHSCRQARLTQEDAADVFQEVFKAAFARINSFEKAKVGDSFRGWLRTITRHKVIDHFRRQEREARGEGGTQMQRRLLQLHAPDPGASTTSESSVKKESTNEPERQLFQQALDAIRSHFHERTWRAFHGTVVDGRSPGDVGEELGMSAGAVRVAKSRVLQRLRSELGDR